MMLNLVECKHKSRNGPSCEFTFSVTKSDGRRFLLPAGAWVMKHTNMNIYIMDLYVFHHTVQYINIRGSSTRATVGTSLNSPRRRHTYRPYRLTEN